MGNDNAVTFPLRLRRAAPNVDVSLKTPVLNPLTERTKVDGSWERCMIVAPMTIQLLGQLLIVSSTKDVSLRDLSSDRNLRFTYIRNPQSLRATLLQVSNEGYQAFLSGHTTMNVIQLRMIQIPKHIKTALKILGGKFSTRMLKSLLPRLLNNIKSTGDECVTLTNTTRNEFFRVMKLIQEVSQSVTATQSAHEIKVGENERELVALQQQKERLERAEKIRSQNYREATAAASKAEQIYYEALNKIPTGWTALAKDVIRGLVRIGEKVAEAGSAVVVCIFGRCRSQTSPTYHAPETGGSSEGQDPPSFALEQTVATAVEFYNSLRLFQEALSSKWGDPDMLGAFGTTFRAHQEFVTSLSANSGKIKVIRLIERAEHVVKKLSTDAKQAKSSNETDQAVTKELAEIFDKLEVFQSAHQQIDQKAASTSISNIGKGGSGPADSSQNEVLKAQILQNQLTEMRRRQDVQTAEYLKLIETLQNTNSKMMLIDLTTVNYKEIIVMLNESFVLLGQVHEQWNDFLIFFTQMAIHIENMVKGPLKRFLDVASEGSNEEHAARVQLILILKDETYSIHREAYILYVMSRTYYEVSSKYFMGRLSSLSSMLVARDESQRKLLMESLQSQTDQALRQIRALILQRKKTFDKELNARYTELGALIEQLGGPNEDDQCAIAEGKKLIEADATWGDE